MQNVSQAWKDNQNNTLVSESFAEVVLTLTDPEAFEDASSVDNGAAYISNTEQVTSEVDKDIVPYATLEKNLWLLDGGLKAIPKPTGNNLLPSNANLTSCTRNGDVFTRTAKVYDSILPLGSWKPEAGKVYIIVVDILDEVLTPNNFLQFLTDTRFAFETTRVSLKNGKNYISVRTRDALTSDMLGSVWLNSQQDLPSFRFTLSILDGADFGDCGYVGNLLSDGTRGFKTNPMLTINFSRVHSNLLSGVTISWGTAYDEYAVDFTVTAYNGDTIVATKAVTGNADVKSVVYMDIVDYDRITISVSKWCLPHRRARIAEVLIGVEKTYSKKELFSFSHSQTIDPISASLPKSEITMSVDNSDNSYNPNNLNSLSKYLIERQEIKARCGFKLGNRVEWIKCGTFYMSEWDTPQNGITATFTARDLLEYMTDNYYRGRYVPEGISLYNLAVDVLETANLPRNDDGSVKWVIDDYLKEVYTIAPLPIDTFSNCLQLIANAAGCAIYQDRTGTLRIEKILQDNMGDSTDYAITNFNSYSKSDISLSKPLKQVDVDCYSYTVASEESELFKSTLNINGTVELWITYSSPATNVRITVTGGTLVSSDIFNNACMIKVAGTGSVSVVIKGYAIENSSVIVTTPSGTNGETVTVDNILVTSHENAINLGSITERYMKNRMILKSSWRADPRLDAGDIVDNENDYSVNKVIMTNVKYEYSGAFRGSGEGRVI